MNTTKGFITDFRSLLDKKRFEEQIIDGQSGFYDKIEQVFIPENVFANLFSNIGPIITRMQMYFLLIRILLF